MSPRQLCPMGMPYPYYKFSFFTMNQIKSSVIALLLVLCVHVNQLKAQTANCASAVTWSTSTAYVAGDLVTYSNVLYHANFWTQGNRPDQHNGGGGSGQPWTMIGACTGSGTPTGTGPSGTTSMFVNCGQIPAWNSATAYLGGAQVKHNGLAYLANWWTQNNIPDANNGGPGSGQPWTLLGNCTAPVTYWQVDGNSNLTSPSVNFIGSKTSIPLIFKSNNVEGLRISTSGIVGVNAPTLDTVTAAAHGVKLGVNGNATIGLTRSNSIGSGAKLYFNLDDNTDPQWISRYNVANNKSELRFAIGDDYQESNDNANDYFVIGVDRPSQPEAQRWKPLFSVSSSGNARLLGKLAANQVFVSHNPLTENFPDYVFDKDYKLMSLDSLKSYINTNKHLPEVPSAAEVKTAGQIDLGEMNAILLKKVEELTLHMIRQEEELKALKEQVNKK